MRPDVHLASRLEKTMDPFDAISACETLIQEHELQNDSSGRVYSENVIARRMLKSRDQLADAYTELYFSVRFRSPSANVLWPVDERRRPVGRWA